MGNTFKNYVAREMSEDHPHLRGEYRLPARLPGCQAGSPPLAWGIPWDGNGNHNYMGITPTCVGNTVVYSIRFNPDQDHPHLRGEYSTAAVKVFMDAVSPPLAWGILSRPQLKCCLVGITPTCVGNTCCSGDQLQLPGDHPHLRGEYRLTWLRVLRTAGSPPLAWGIPEE